VLLQRTAAQLGSAKPARVQRFNLDSRVEPVVAVWNDEITPDRRGPLSRFRAAAGHTR
jgi:hypothetical protein